MPTKSLHTDQAPAAIGPYSQAVVANGLLFTAGQIPLDPASGQVVAGDVVAQTEQVLRNLGAVLASAAATWTDVVKTTVFLTDMRDFPRMMYVLSHNTALAVETNTITLDPEVKDAWGLPAIRVTYRDHPETLKTEQFMQRLHEAIAQRGGQ